MLLPPRRSDKDNGGPPWPPYVYLRKQRTLTATPYYRGVSSLLLLLRRACCGHGHAYRRL